ncbi:hypothetical protein [Natronospira proteinivora]|nr:hypothetical protein [Natronospira proteinivora]
MTEFGPPPWPAVTVRPDRPRVEGSTLHLSWTQSGGGPLFRHCHCFIRYPRQSLENLPPAIAWSVFSGLIASLYARHHQELTLHFPEPIPRMALAPWLDLHRCDNVVAGPLKESEAPGAPSTSEPEHIGILFGGGKDSLATLGLMGELFGYQRLTLLSCVFPERSRYLRTVEQRRDRHALGPIRGRTGVRVQKIISNLRCQIGEDASSRALHTGLYHALALPMTRQLGLELVTHSNEFNHYWTSTQPNRPRAGFARSRPEADDFLADALSRLLQQPLSIKNPNFCIGKDGAIRLLKERYPGLLTSLMMCESVTDPNQRWCGNCYKCFQYAIYRLALNLPDAGLDPQTFFAESEWVQDHLARASQAKVGQWLPELSSRASFPAFSHLFHQHPPDTLAKQLSGQAKAHFLALTRPFPREPHPATQAWMQAALDKLAPPRTRQLAAILDQHLPRETARQIQLPWGSHRSHIDYDAAIAPKTVAIETPDADAAFKL